MPHKLFIFVPAFGHHVSTTTFLSALTLQQGLAQKGIGVGVTSLSFPDIGESRNMAFTIFYDGTDASHLLMIDADMGFEPQLVLDMLLFNEPIVGACYPKRTQPLEWTPSGTGEPTATLRAGFMHVEGVGMGCTLIRRDAVTTMLEHFPDMVDTRVALHPARGLLDKSGVKRIIRAFDPIDIPERGKLSEDLSFCWRWNQCGGQVWANVAHRLSHVGPFDYAGCYLDTVAQQQQAAEAQAKAQAEIAAAKAQAEIQAQPKPQDHPETSAENVVIFRPPQPVGLAVVHSAQSVPDHPHRNGAAKPAKRRTQKKKLIAAARAKATSSRTRLRKSA